MIRKIGLAIGLIHTSAHIWRIENTVLYIHIHMWMFMFVHMRRFVLAAIAFVRWVNMPRFKPASFQSGLNVPTVHSTIHTRWMYDFSAISARYEVIKGGLTLLWNHWRFWTYLKIWLSSRSHMREAVAHIYTVHHPLVIRNCKHHQQKSLQIAFIITISEGGARRCDETQ